MLQGHDHVGGGRYPASGHLEGLSAARYSAAVPCPHCLQSVLSERLPSFKSGPVGSIGLQRVRTKDGANGYVWTFSTPTERYFLRRGRGKTVVDEALSDAFSGVLVSDFYAAYHHYDGPKQRCWAHLLRDIHDLRTLYPDAAPLARWADAVHGIYDRAKAFTHPQAKRRRTAQLALERQLLALGQPFRHDPSATQAKLCRRIERHIKELFVFVAEPAVPSDNNAAERSLRHLVISRKISGGTRSEQGTESKMTLASIFGTWRAQGLNPLAACRQLLVSLYSELLRVFHYPLPTLGFVQSSGIG